MQKYSIFSLIKNAFGGHKDWEVAWKDSEPKKEYDVVIIGAFIGTEDLGQYIMKALSDLKGGGKALILGLCVAFIGLAVDNLIRTWANKRKKLLGLEEY